MTFDAMALVVLATLSPFTLLGLLVTAFVGWMAWTERNDP